MKLALKSAANRAGEHPPHIPKERIRTWSVSFAVVPNAVRVSFLAVTSTSVCVICPLTKFFKVFNSLILSVCFCPLTFSQRCTNAMPEPCLLIIALCKNGTVLFLFYFPSSSEPLFLREAEGSAHPNQLRPRASSPVCILRAGGRPFC